MCVPFEADGVAVKRFSETAGHFDDLAGAAEAMPSFQRQVK
jgi:hypothetical protein